MYVFTEDLATLTTPIFVSLPAALAAVSLTNILIESQPEHMYSGRMQATRMRHKMWRDDATTATIAFNPAQCGRANARARASIVDKNAAGV